MNRSWLSNTSRLAFQQFDKNRLPSIDASAIQISGGKVALVAGGACTNEDLAALKMLKEALGDRAELFGGSLLKVGAPDGIAKSGDPVANRAGMQLMGFADVAELLKRAGEFSNLVTVNADLYGEDASAAKVLDKISNRIALSAFDDATAK